MAHELWVEKYRPKTIDGYVFRDDRQKRTVESWIAEGNIPHLLLSGQAGLGKTTLARLILNEIGAHPGDVLEINGSDQTGIENIRVKLQNFISVMPFGEFRYVIVDEADYLTGNAQAGLRNITETYSNVARFILTCNKPHKIIPALHSRFQTFHFDKLDREEFVMRIATILMEENVEVDDLDLLDSFIAATYPDMRKCINNIQQSVYDGKLESIAESDATSTHDYLVAAIEKFKKGDYVGGRTTICKYAHPEHLDELFTFAYRNLELWTTDPSTQAAAIVVIRDAMAKAPMCADLEINIACMFVELELLT